MPLALQNQENLVHEHRNAAALKPLNQTSRPLGPKTPLNNGSRTTKVPLNTEVRTNRGTSRAQRQGNGDENAKPGKASKADKSLYATPVAPRDRAPLGAKTTNAKASAFQTPAPLTQKTQRLGTSARKHKLKIHRAQAEEDQVHNAAVDEEEPEIEYCPPREIPLPDYPDLADEWPMDKDLSILHGPGRLAGLFVPYTTAAQEEAAARREELMEKKFNDAIERSLAALPDLEQMHGEKVQQHSRPANITAKQQLLTTQAKVARIGTKPEPTPRNTLTSSSPTMNSRTAARVLTTPSYLEPTATSQARSKPSVSHTPAATAKRMSPNAVRTIGYKQGRKTSSALKKAQPTTLRNTEMLSVPAEFQRESDEAILEQLLRESALEEEEREQSIFVNEDAVNDFFLADAEKEFVLEMPED